MKNVQLFKIAESRTQRVNCLTMISKESFEIASLEFNNFQLARRKILKAFNFFQGDEDLQDRITINYNFENQPMTKNKNGCWATFLTNPSNLNIIISASKYIKLRIPQIIHDKSASIGQHPVKGGKKIDTKNKTWKFSIIKKNNNNNL